MATLYAAQAGSLTTSDLYTVNPATAAVTSVGPIGFAVTGLAMDPTTQIMYGATSNNSAANPRSLITVNTGTGAGTLVGSFGLANPTPDIFFDDIGQLYGWDPFGAGDLLEINKATGSVTHLGPSVAQFGCGSDHDPVSGDTYACLDGTWLAAIVRGFLWSVDIGTGNATSGPRLDEAHVVPQGLSVNAGTFSEAGVFYVAINVSATDVRLVTVDLATGAITSIGNLGGRFDALAWDRTPPSGPPVNLSLPTITGTPLTGHILTGHEGTWTGLQPITYAFQWQRCDAGGGNCVDITGETATTYLTAITDVGATIRLKVTATNNA